MSGLGHVITAGKNSWIPKIKEVTKNGLLIYAVTQTIYGRVDPYVYESGRRLQDAGVVYLEDMTAETAFAKLGWVLGHKEWRGTVATAKKMTENISKEFNERLN
jgi:glutamyl-tRNA(Gln) amidotransferase subunit D